MSFRIEPHLWVRVDDRFHWSWHWKMSNANEEREDGKRGDESSESRLWAAAHEKVRGGTDLPPCQSLDRLFECCRSSNGLAIDSLVPDTQHALIP